MNIKPLGLSWKGIGVRVIAIIDGAGDVLGRRRAADRRRDIPCVAIAIGIQVIRRHIRAAHTGSELSCGAIAARLNAVLAHTTRQRRHTFMRVFYKAEEPGHTETKCWTSALRTD